MPQPLLSPSLGSESAPVLDKKTEGGELLSVWRETYQEELCPATLVKGPPHCCTTAKEDDAKEQGG